jgi:hypothetical protein
MATLLGCGPSPKKIGTRLEEGGARAFHLIRPKTRRKIWRSPIGPKIQPFRPKGPDFCVDLCGKYFFKINIYIFSGPLLGPKFKNPQAQFLILKARKSPSP